MRQMLQSPPEVYKEKGSDNVLHYVKPISEKKVFRIVLRGRTGKQGNLTSLHLVTTATVDGTEYKKGEKRYEKIR
jgi:hypothetical protein